MAKLKEHRLMVVDTETTSLEGFVYDIGYTVANKRGKIYVERNWLVKEIFTSGAEMMGAFYAKKFFSFYAQALADGEITLEPWASIVETMRQDVASFEVTAWAAYNLQFDKKVIRNTQKRLGNGSTVFAFAPKELCLWRFARQTRLKGKQYSRWCRANGFLTKGGKPQTTAEIAYRYIFGDWDFAEPHTALGDAQIETEIMAACFSQRKKIPWF